MAVRARISLSKATRCLAVGRHYTVTSANRDPNSNQSSRAKRPNSSDVSESKTSPTGRSSSDSYPDSPAAKIFSHQPVIVPRRPPVKPPPTLTLPPSVSTPAIRSLPPKLSKKSTAAEADAAEGQDGPAADIWTLYQGSLNERDAKPTLQHLMALRPAVSTIAAALEGELGVGRTLLPENHQLRLDIEYLGAQEAPVGGGPLAKKMVSAGSNKAKKLEYMALYEATERSISKRFTVVQLRHFEEELQSRKRYHGKNDTKPKIIHRIMYQQFRMPHPTVIANQLAEVTDKIEELYPISPSDLFILLGRDGENLLNVSRQLQLNVSVDRDQPTSSKEGFTSETAQTESPRFVLRALGTKANHQRLKKYLEELRKSVIARLVVLPIGPPLAPSRLRTISRIADAFCENVTQPPEDLEDGEGPRASVLVTARDARNAYTAERLVERAVLEDAHRSRITLLSLVQPVPPTSTSVKYALYPFDDQNFRLQRVRYLKRLPENASLENIVHFQYRDAKPERQVDEDEAIVLGEHAPLNTGEDEGQGITSLLATEDGSSASDAVATSLSGEVVDLRRLLFDTVPPAQGSTRKATATFGHITYKGTDSSSLLPPLKEPVSIAPALEWAAKQGSDSRYFTPGVVPPLVGLAPTSAKSMHQLQYQMVNGDELVDVSVELPPAEDSPIEPAGANETRFTESESADALELGDKNNKPNPLGGPISPVQAEITDSDKAGPLQETEITSEPESLPFEISIGTKSVAEVMIPDGTLDISLQVSSSQPLEPARVPEALQTYLNELSKFFTTDADMFQPDPPQSFYLEEKQFMLVKNTSGQHGVAPVSFNAPGSSVVTETTLDLENNAELSFTRVSYDEQHGTVGWAAFLRLCQVLAAKPYEREISRVKPSVI